jgi:quercetin dioxygenase-like cupin family protein
MTGHEHVHGDSHSEVHSSGDVVDLAGLARGLVADLPEHKQGRHARTVLSGPRMRAAVIALAAGAELAEHESPPAATLYVVTGRVTLRAGEQEWSLTAGQLVPIPPARHSVQAHEDAAILLTVAL